MSGSKSVRLVARCLSTWMTQPVGSCNFTSATRSLHLNTRLRAGVLLRPEYQALHCGADCSSRSRRRGVYGTRWLPGAARVRTHSKQHHAGMPCLAGRLAAVPRRFVCTPTPVPPPDGQQPHLRGSLRLLPALRDWLALCQLHHVRGLCPTQRQLRGDRTVRARPDLQSGKVRRPTPPRRSVRGR